MQLSLSSPFLLKHRPVEQTLRLKLLPSVARQWTLFQSHSDLSFVPSWYKIRANIFFVTHLWFVDQNYSIKSNLVGVSADLKPGTVIKIYFLSCQFRRCQNANKIHASDMSPMFKIITVSPFSMATIYALVVGLCAIMQSEGRDSRARQSFTPVRQIHPSVKNDLVDRI